MQRWCMVKKRKDVQAVAVCEDGTPFETSMHRYMMEVSRANPDMRDLESLISGIQQVVIR